MGAPFAALYRRPAKLTAEGCAEDEFGKSAELRRMARHSFLEAEAKHQARIAQASRNRAFKADNTGDWV